MRLSTDYPISRYLLFVGVPGFILAMMFFKGGRESTYGPDYYDRSTPTYPGEKSRWAHNYIPTWDIAKWNP